MPEPEGARARARAALLAVASAEITDHGSRRKLYEVALQSYAEAHPDLPSEEVCVACFAEITHHIWLKWGKERGIPEADCAPSKAYFWRIASELGFTHRYAQYDADDDGNSTSGIEEANSLISEEEHDVEVPDGSVAVREALSEMRSALSEAHAFLRTADATELAGREAVETFTVEARAMSQGLREVISRHRRVPANLQPLFITLLAMVATADALVRRLGAALLEPEMDGRRLTRKAMANIVRGRYAGVPLCLEPRSLWAAVWRGYHGAPCPKCASRRTVPDTAARSCPTLHCLACADGESFPAPDWVTCRACHQPVTDASMVDCPHCGEPLRAPPGGERRLLAP